jgi:hypothetical protein
VEQATSAEGEEALEGRKSRSLASLVMTERRAG